MLTCDYVQVVNAEPTAGEVKIMTNRKLIGQQEMVCVVSYKPVTGQYYDNPEGPVLPGTEAQPIAD